MKQRRSYNILFGITLAALAALGTWWLIFFERTITLERAAQLKELRAAVTVAAMMLGHRNEPPVLGQLEGAHPLEVVSANEPGVPTPSTRCPAQATYSPCAHAGHTPHPR